MVRLMGNHLIIPGGTRAIDATGKFIMPGGIDMNVHLQRPGFGTQTIDDFYQVRNNYWLVSRNTLVFIKMLILMLHKLND